MTRTVVVVSSLVDANIREGQPDTSFILKRTLEELAEHIETTPIRADYLYFTQETIPRINTSLNYLITMLGNPFLRIDHVCYITEKGAKELSSLNYIIAEKELKNWEIVEGYLTREYVSGIITGSLRTDTFNKKRKALYRVPREAYLRQRIKDKQQMEAEYLDDEKLLKDVPPLDVPEPSISDSSDVAEIFHVAGLPSKERTALVLLLAQYLSMGGKTLIVEKDKDYHTLTEFITKAEIECRQIPVQEFYDNPNGVIEEIRTCREKLVCITTVDRVDYSYAFMCNVLYNSLSAKIAYFIREDDFEEVPMTNQYLVSMPADMLGILRVCEEVDVNFVHLMRFVAVNLMSLPETRITNEESVDLILSDVLEKEVRGSCVINVRSLRIGGDSGYDLRSVLGL